MSKDLPENIENLFNPEKLKAALLKASIYLIAYELLKSGIVDKLKSFFSSHFEYDDKLGKILNVESDDFKNKVLSLYPKDVFHSCCLWFYESKIISEEDLNIIPQIRKVRNIIAHELPKFINKELDIDHSLLDKILIISSKIDLWWIKEVEALTDPEFDLDDFDKIDWDVFTGENTFLLQLLEGVYRGDETYLKNYYSLLKLAWENRKG